NGESTSSILSKPEIEFVKVADSLTAIKTNKDETVRKPYVKYAKITPIRINKPNMNAAQPKRTSFYKPAHSYVKRPIQRKSTVRTQFRVPRASTSNIKFPTVNKNFPIGNSKLSTADLGNKGKANYIDDKGYWDSGCSRHMTGNISYLSDYEPYNGGYVSFGQGGCKITGKGTIKTGKLEFENVYFVKDLKYNLFSVLQIYDNQNSVLFTDSECIVVGRNFKLKDDTNVLLRTPRQHNMYSNDLNNVFLHKDLTCLVAKASVDESMLCHMRLGHLNFKTMNRLVRYNLVKGLPSKCFDNDHTCVTCLKGKQHKAFCKTKFTWTFFLKTKNETNGILRNFIIEIENLKEQRKGIKREFSNARTPQQNGVAERRNRTLIEAAKTMLADVKLFVTFWAEVVNTACYVQNMVLVNKSQNKTPYKLFNGTTSTNFSGIKEAVSQDVKKDVSSLRYIALPNWFHEVHLETSTSNAQDACKADAPESSGNSNPTATSTNPPDNQMEVLTVETSIPTISSPVPTSCLDDSPQLTSDTRLISKRVTSQNDTPSLDNILTLSNKLEDILGVTTNTGDTNGVKADLSNMENNISASPTPTFRIYKDHPTRVRPIGTKWVLKIKKDERGIVIRNKGRLVAQGHTQEEGIDYEEVFAPVARIEVIRLFLAYASFMGFTVYQMDVKSVFLYGTIDEDVYVMQPPGFQDLEFPARVYKVEKAMYGLHQAPRAWYGTLSKYLLTNGFQRGSQDKKHERGIVIKNKARLVAQGHTQEEGIDYDEVFTPVARIEAIRLFLAYASFIGFTVYQMNVKSAFLYGTIDEEVYVMQPPGFQDPEYPTRVYKVEKAIEFEALMHEKFQMSAMGELNFFLGLQVLQKEDGIFLSQDKYVGDILKKFGYSDVRSSNTLMDKEIP
nr:hypothetical protein [Tanacetum cinerariifolium]